MPAQADINFERELWDVAVALRGTVAPADYSTMSSRFSNPVYGTNGPIGWHTERLKDPKGFKTLSVHPVGLTAKRFLIYLSYIISPNLPYEKKEAVELGECCLDNQLCEVETTAFVMSTDR